MSEPHAFGLFEVTGVEIEYAIVDSRSLAVRPIADRLIEAESGEIVSEIARDEIAWSNEVVLHVIELKTNGPAASREGLSEKFQSNVERMNELLAPMGAKLMPGAMHPFMDPLRETRLWPHEYGPVYAAFDRIFGCSGHGWSNVQSVHINLPFRDDEEFGRLHAAIRLALPLLPALAASSPIVEGERTGILDSRLEYYRQNARRIPSISGRIIPEPAFTRGDYERVVLEMIYKDLAPHDPEGLLRHEWVNARGCIARFERGSIEIRVLDTAECPQADLAIVEATVALLRALIEERFESYEAQRRWPTRPLAALFVEALRKGERARIRDQTCLAAFGYPGKPPCTLRELWQHLIETLPELPASAREVLEVILEKGPLARRLLRRLGRAPGRERIEAVYHELCSCLAHGKLFDAGG